MSRTFYTRTKKYLKGLGKMKKTDIEKRPGELEIDSVKYVRFDLVNRKIFLKRIPAKNIGECKGCYFYKHKSELDCVELFEKHNLFERYSERLTSCSGPSIIFVVVKK